jgi:hypothetical protein
VAPATKTFRVKTTAKARRRLRRARRISAVLTTTMTTSGGRASVKRALTLRR